MPTQTKFPLRQNAADQVAASLRAEGLAVTSAAELIIEQWIDGKIGTEEMEHRIRDLHGIR